MELNCKRHKFRVGGSTKNYVSTASCDHRGDCEKRFLEKQYVASYSYKYRDQDGSKQSDFYTKIEEDVNY